MGRRVMVAAEGRKIVYADFDGLLDDVAFCRGDHRTLGNWTFAQTCWHLAATFNGSIDGFDLSRHRMKRIFLGRKLLRLTFERGIPRGFTADVGLNPPTGVHAESEVERLNSAIDRYRRHDGRLRAHPLFGRLARDNWDRLHLFHAAHHMSLVLPPPRPHP